MNREQALVLVHVARKDLSIDEDAWRDLLRQQFHVASSKDLDIYGLHRLIEHLKKCGFKVRHAVSQAAKSRRGAPARSRPLHGAAQERPGESAKIRALWLFLHAPLGLVRDPSEKALMAYVQRLTGVEALQWLDGNQTYRVIETLKKWAERVFLERIQERVAHVGELLANGWQPDARLLDEVRRCVVRAQESRTRAGKPGAYDACVAAWEALEALGSEDRGQRTEDRAAAVRPL
jgi:phage gp16-like protein